MDVEKDRKRKKDKNRDDDSGKERKSKRARSRSRSHDKNQDRDSRRKRKHSRSQSPADKREKNDRNREEPKEPAATKVVPERKAKDADMLNTRTGGAYIPPARLRMMQAQITDKSSMAYQRLAWEALKKSIHGHINKINVGNIGIIIKELLKENIVRGRGLLCRSVIQAQAASPTFTNVYAALVSAVNSRFPNIGELLLKRLVIQFKRGFKRNDKPTCISSASFIAHLVNQRVAHEILALELLTLLVETPTDDSVEVAIAFLKECGQKLTEVSSKGVNAIFEMLRNILHEGQLDKRVQYMIEVMFQVWKDGFKDHPALIEELELVPEEEQFTHLLMLDDATDPQDILNVFKHDEKYEENEQKYKTLSKEILGSDAESGEEDGSGESGSEESDDEEEESEQKEVTIIDNTETNLVALRRTIYLTINSSLDFEECAHKLMKMQLKPGQEIELCHMFLDCCAEQRTYEKFYGLLAQRFCNINRMYIGPFEEIFKDSYSTAHRLDTNRLRNVSKFFAHLLFTDSISWEVLECVKLNEEDTTSSSRIYIKILFQELAEYMGLKKLNDRLKDPTLQEAFSGVFPRDNPKNTRFSINFFTSIGLGGLTDELREHLKQMPKNVPPPITEIHVSSSSSSSSSSSDSSSSSSDSSSSDSEEENKKEKHKKSKKDKNKDKTQKNTEETDKDKPVERWGHDGFYDTYGKDARRDARPDRLDTRPERPDTRPERNDDGFARPRDVPRRADRRNGDDRRRDDSRSDRDAEDSRRQNDRRNDDRRRDDGARSDSGYEDSRRHQDERRNGDDRRRDEVSRRNEGERRRDRDEDSRRQQDRRDRDDVRERNRDDDRRRDDKGEEGYYSRDDDRDRRREDRTKRSDKDDSRSRKEDDRKSKDGANRDSNREDRNRNENNSDSEDERNKKKERKRDDKRSKDYDRNREESDKESDSGGDRNKKQERKRDDKRTKVQDKNKEERCREENDRDSDSEDDRNKKKERKRDDKRTKVHDKNREERYREENDRDSDSEDDRNKKKERQRGSGEETRSKKKKQKYEKENIDNERKKKSKRKESSSESEDETYKDKKQREDGWDIRRASSIRRDAPTSYWDTYPVDIREGKRSKDRKER